MLYSRRGLPKLGGRGRHWRQRGSSWECELCSDRPSVQRCNDRKYDDAEDDVFDWNDLKNTFNDLGNNIKIPAHEMCCATLLYFSSG